MSDENVDRRKVLKAMAAATASGMAIPAASTSASASTESPSVNYDEVDDSSLFNKIFSQFSDSQDYEVLKDYLQTNYEAAFDESSTTVIEVSEAASEGDILGYMVNVPMEDDQESDVAGIGGKVSGQTVSASASRRKVTDTGETRVDTFSIDDGQVQESRVEGSRTQLQSQASSISASASSSLECEACKITYNTLASVGCGVTVAGVCAAAGLATGGGALAVCAVVVPAVCGAFGSVQYGTGYTAEEICSGEAAGEANSLLYCG